MADKDTSLVPYEPPPKLARSLETARSRDLVHIDRKGQVRSPARYRAIQLAAYGLLAGVLGLGGVVYYLILGVPGVAALVGIAGLSMALPLSASIAMRKGLRLLVNERVDEAAAQFERHTRRRLLNRSLRGIAEMNLATCRAMQGRHAEALALARSAQRRLRRKVYAAMAAHAEILALVHTDQVPEARARLAALGGEPTGDFLRVGYWSVELYVCLADGKHAFSADELHRRARVALAITSAAPLLGLLAWAFEQSGDRDMAEHLLAEALDRHPGALLSRRMPKLQAWLDAQPKG